MIEVFARLEAACGRAEFELPRLAAPDGTVAVQIADLRMLLDAQGIEARQGGDAKQAPSQDESPVAEGNAPEKDSSHD